MKLRGSSICLLIFSLFITSLAGASTPDATSDAASQEAAGGAIVFYRPKGFFGAGMRPEISLDGKVVGKSSPGRKFQVEVSPGAHKVTIPNSVYSGERALEVTVVNGETTYVRTSLGGSAFGGRTNIEFVDAPTGEAEANKLKLVSYGIKGDGGN